jgi:hypothetical protein
MALQKLGKYEIVSEIGRGAMGVVYKAFDPILEREVALKTMMTSMAGMDGESKARFYREARSAAKLTHRNIVTIYDMGEEQGIPFIAMEFLDGVDLHRKMKREGPLPLREALDITTQVLHGLHYAHQFQIVHRDVKPANIYILRNGTAKILDFGIAKLATSEMTRTGMVLGTVDYMSPEQIRADKGVDGRSDLFSVGVILYELVAARKPFPGETITQIMFKIVHDPPGDLGSERELPQRLVEISKRSLEKDPARRFANGEEFARALEEVIQQIDAEVTTVRQMSPAALDARGSVSAARRLYEGGSFEESAAILKQVLTREPENKEATALLTLVDRRVGGEQTVALEAEPETARPSAPRGSRIEDILAEIEEERKTSPAAAGRSEKEAKDLTLRIEDSGVKEAAPPPPAPAPEPQAKPPRTRPSLRAAAQAPAPSPAPAPEKPAPPPPPPKPAAPPRAAPAPKEAKPAPAPRPPVREERVTDEMEAPAPRTARAQRAAAPAAPRNPVPLIGGAVAVAAALAVGAYLILGRGAAPRPEPGGGPAVRKEAPPAPSAAAPPPPASAGAGYLAVDAHPWAEVAAVREAASGRAVGLPPEPGRPAPTTPIVLDLPPGRYEVVLRHPRFQEVTVRDLAVASGQWTRVNQTMPGYRPKIPVAAP